MNYAYILYSSSTKKLYTGYTPDIKHRLAQHNAGQNQSTKHGVPWRLVWYSGFENKKKAIDFEQYLKSGSGKAFLYKRFVDDEVVYKYFEGWWEVKEINGELKLWWPDIKEVKDPNFFWPYADFKE